MIAVIAIFCCGCTSLVTEENTASEVNEGGIESESLKETDHEQQVSYEEYSGNWTSIFALYRYMNHEKGSRANPILASVICSRMIPAWRFVYI